MTSLDNVIATNQSEWVSFNDEPHFPISSEGDPEELLARRSSSSDRSESSSGEVRAGDGESPDTSHSEQDAALEKLPLVSRTTSPLENPVQSQPGLASAISTWVQFEDESWTGTLSTHQEAAPLLTTPCWTCPSFESLGRCPEASESSWTTHSEDTGSPSIGPSSTDMRSTNAEEHTSGGASGTDTPDNSSSIQEDDEVDMEALSRPASGSPANGHISTPGTTARFPSWVTFDDDEVAGSPSPPSTSPSKSDSPSRPPVPDVLPNFTGSFKKRERPKSTLVELPKVKKLDISSLTRPPSGSETPPPWRATNPFLNESLKDVQPSPINPFSAFFEERERRALCDSTSSPPAPRQRDSLLVIRPESDAISFDGPSRGQTHRDAVEKLKQLRIGDPDGLGGLALPDDDPAVPGEPDDGPRSPAGPEPRLGWPMMLRIPEKKNIMSSRHWGPIYVKLADGGRLQLYYEEGLEKPFREFKLEISHEISEPKLQSYDENGRIHSMRIDRITYKEKRKYQPKPSVAHAAEREQVIKLGTTNYDDFRSFIGAVRDRLMELPVSSLDLCTVGLNYLEEEITVDVKDEFTGVLSQGDNRILQHRVLTHVHVLSFLSGLAECRLGLNDVLVKGNEIVSRHDIVPTTTTKWIKLHDCRFHGCVDEDAFSSSRAILFNPLDACRFELMRFRTVFAEKSLPFTLRTAATINGAEVEVQSWLRMSTGFSSNRDPLTQVPCENVMVRYPVPNEWVKNFRRESVLGEKSLKAKVNRGASFGSVGVSGSEPVMRVTLGTAKYEHAFNSIVWRISRLPDKNSASGHPHCFFCHLELGSDREVPSVFARHVNVEFTMPTTSASKATVRSISVEDKTDVRKWVNYSAHYSYKVEIEQKKQLTQDLEGEDTENPKECGVQ
ncbi:stonin-2 isoform X1 [Ornithorhynchus anatinus]|uniref:Stonin-2 n=1 Tax=Ornithorhynchus anatinus TaxID=9258 RepID=F6V7M3_ORNAN|nr:stonin-2 isoform X1 [Ornithorhynchus anatinus]XP_028927575.1 stonin-2 isoform X1 [Ornithorhynchus anatinus]